MQKQHNIDALTQEISQLRHELQEANSVIDAIKNGEVDALLISDKMHDEVYILRGADHIYRALVEDMQEGCATVTSNGTISFCNKNFAGIIKIPLERVIGSSMLTLLDPHECEPLTSFLKTRRGNFRMECRLKTGAGFSAQVIMSASNVAIEGDPLTCVVITDLTEQRRSERLVQMMFSQAKDPIIACDTRGYITKANPAAFAMLGDHIVGKSFDLMVPLSRSSNGTRLKLGEAIDSDSLYGVEVHYERRDGRRLTLLANAGRFSADDEDNLVGSVIMLADITEKSQLAAEITRLDRLNIIGEVAAGIGHEVRNPLTTVRGYLQLFTRKPKYADDKQQLTLMIEELDRANTIITEFLSLAKDRPIVLRLGNLNDAIHTIFPLLQADAFRLGHEIQLELGDIEGVLYDDSEIRQLIINLVRNGLESMVSCGVVTIKTYRENEKAILSVQDTGVGIPRDVSDKIGTPFFTTKKSGTGLGLPVCYRIVEGHCAEMEFESSCNGTTFFIKFKTHGNRS